MKNVLRPLPLRVTAIALTGLVAGCGTPSHLGASMAPVARARAMQAASLADLYPAELGRTWTYSTLQRTNDGPQRPGEMQRFEIVDASASADGWSAVMRRFYGSREMPATRVLRLGDRVDLSRALNPELGSLTVLRWPAAPGPEWAGRTWAQAAEHISIVGTESVTVPAGTYVAVRTLHRIAYASGHEDRLQYWYAPGIGMVKAVEGLTIDLGAGPQYQEVTASLTSTAIQSPGSTQALSPSVR